MIGSRLAHYEIKRHLGTGGMGEVYEANDSKLGRSVAIKLLPEAFSHDSDRVSRFKREARVLASLNHPNIAAIYGLEESGGRKFLVMELVPGETLAEKIKRGAIPLAETLGIATQITNALEVAHEKSVVHRDLKPANVKITPEGVVKVLDFGLAKAYAPDPTEVSLTNSPTLTAMATQKGVILGTAAYMSPEQAKGKDVDRRTDIFAFGAVLYEMLTGRAAFDGEDVQDIIGAVLKSEPDFRRLPAGTPPSLHRLLRRTMQKDARQRLGDIRDARIEIEEAKTEGNGSVTSSRRGARLAWIASLAIAAVLMVALAILAVRHLRETPPLSPAEMRVEISTPSTTAPLHFALSPDGRHLVFVASGGGSQGLWLRALDKSEAQPLARTDGAEFPFWSADSRSIGFFSSDKLFRMDIGGGPPQFLAAVSERGGLGGAWNADGTILFAPKSTGPLFRIAASGGEPVAVTMLDPPRQLGHRFPKFLPDGRHFLFYAVGSSEASSIYLGSIDGGKPRKLTAADASGAYLHPGWVVFVQQGALVARRLDIVRGELVGDPVTLADPVGYDAGFSLLSGLSVSDDGRIAYRVSGVPQLTWLDRAGKAVGVGGGPDAHGLVFPELSPDGQSVAGQRAVQNNADVWLLDLVRGGFTRFTFDPALDGAPLWSPDGTRIAFDSNRKGAFNLYLKPLSGARTEELLLETANNKIPQDWSKDGRFLLYREVDRKSNGDLWALEMTGSERKPHVVINTPFEERNGQFSPDGRWVAYETNESGRFEIVVQPFPDPRGKWQVSTNGGAEPRWRADAKELYFIAPDGNLMAVSVVASGSTFEAGKSEILFPTQIRTTSVTGIRPQYAVSRDGRFLINQAAQKSSSAPIMLILNWKPKP
jgi:Tol biopolymer transport system component